MTDPGPFGITEPSISDIGFTGTQKGMTSEQKLTLYYLLAEMVPLRGHHGDCIGADKDFHDLCKKFYPSLWIIGHPPNDPKKRAFCRVDKSNPPLNYLARNRAIVQASDMLIATPSENKEIRRSGTWATIRYAREKGIPIKIILPDGSIKEENCGV